MPRVRSISDAEKIEKLTAELSAIKVELQLAIEAKNAIAAEVGAISSQNKQLHNLNEMTAKHVAEMKERIHFAEVNAAKMQGYLARVEEDDQTRDGFHHVDDGRGEIHVQPKRPPMRPDIARGAFDDGYARDGGASMGYEARERPRRVHWTRW